MPGCGDISTTIQSPEGEVVHVTVYWYGCLVEVEYVCLNIGFRLILCVSYEWVHDTHRMFYGISYLISQQKDLIWLLCTYHPVPNDTLTKQSGHLFCFCEYIVEAS